ncbi:MULTISPECIES: hypothetical protein [Bacillus]|nr:MULTISPECIES: hypothetical protein [Bacillus]MCU5223159.1 hypothetical protein [Bacillus tropicus]MDA1644583.1 hypothetical protein [Bacillus cereus group sp. TH163-1LC]MDA1795538.1 hypothetical protein [Bacillus cereus group sp. BY8-1LC]MDA1879936.1 hypothetical protein [Bacillus cereus group sp. BY10-2LC]MDV5067511.1 hypothetical protein [Bacillus sp. W1]
MTKRSQSISVVIMSFAAWSAIFMTLIGPISGAIFGTISSRN